MNFHLSLPREGRDELQRPRLLAPQPIILIEEVLKRRPTREEEKHAADVLAGGDELGVLLHETAEEHHARAGANHNDGAGGVGGEFERGCADVDEDFTAVEFGAGASEVTGRLIGVSVLPVLVAFVG